MNVNIVGISAFYHDSACCLLKNGKIVAVAEEERFSRIKHDSSFPVNAFKYCIEQGNISIGDINYIVYYENPVKKLSRQIWTGYDYFDPKYTKLMNPKRPEEFIRNCLGYEGKIIYLEHHLSHAAGAFYYSGFDESAILTIDGVGELATTSYGIGKNNKIEILEEVDFPNSIGLLYSAFTAYLGFRVNSGEYKVMGLAPYGKPKYVDKIRKMITFEKGQYKIDMDYFDFISEGQNMYTDKLEKLLGKPARMPETDIDPFYMDVAKSLQVVLEEVIFKMSQYLYEKTRQKNLCLSGGVALNCVANGKLLKNGPFEKIYVQPAANDAGGVMGAVAEVYSRICNREKRVEKINHVFWGPEYTNEEIQSILDAAGIIYEDYTNREDQLYQSCAELLAEENVIAWFQGRMEFGPRALGNRSILADPRVEDMRDRINKMVKKREGFRPFAPSVLEEECKNHFDIKDKSPYMLFTAQVNSSINMPAITHVDYSARIQTVSSKENSKYYKLINAFFHLTGCPVVLNTSFNVRGEPIVMTPLDAIICFANTNMDYLVLGDMLIDRKKNKWSLLKILNKNLRTARNTVDGIRYTFI